MVFIRCVPGVIQSLYHRMSDEQDFEVCNAATDLGDSGALTQSQSEFTVCLGSEEYEKLLWFKGEYEKKLGQISELKSRIEKYQKQRVKFQEQKVLLQNRLHFQTHQYSSLRDQWRQRQEATKRMIECAREESKEKERLKGEIPAIKEENQRLNRELSKRGDQIKQTEKEVEKLEVILAEYRAQLFTAKDQEAGLLNEMETKHQKEVRRVEESNQGIIKELGSKIENLALKSSSYSLEINKLKCLLTETEEELQESKDIKQQLTIELKQSKNMIHEFKQSVMNYSLQMQAKNMELSECQYKLKKLESVLSSKGSEQDLCHQLRKEIWQRETIINIMDGELKGLKIKYEQLSSEGSSKIEKLKNELRKYEPRSGLLQEFKY